MNGRPEATVAARGAVAAAGAALVVATLVVADGPARFTTYAGRSSPAAALTACAVVSLAAAGVCGAGARRGAMISVLPLLAAVAWIAPVWVGWHGGSALVRSIALAAAGFLVALVVHTAARVPGGRSTTRAARALIAAAYAEALVSAVVLALVRDPYLDRRCLANCDVNVFLVSAHPRVADSVQDVDRWFVAAVAIAAVALLGGRVGRASQASRRRLLPVAAPLVLFAAAVVVRAALLQTTAVEDPFDNYLFATFVVSASALVLFGAGLLIDVVRRHREQRAIAALVADLGETPAPGSLQAALAHALGDPDLTIRYWLPEPARWLDGDGNRRDEPSAAGRRLTRVARDGETVAVVRHSGAMPDLADELGSAALLSLENERLQAGVLEHLEEIRASRARIVQTGDAERRRLERNLHDGAQQRLLALSYDLRLAQASARGTEAATLLAAAVDETKRALADLRELAHGIYPAALTEVGLPAALETLAESARLPVEVTTAADRRWPDAVESVAYFAAVEAVDDAYRRGASYVTLLVAGDVAQLVLETGDDGMASQPPPIALVDRVVARGGVALSKPDGLRLEIPCASS